MLSLPTQALDEAALQRFAAQFAGFCQAGDVIYLRGCLGAGKTTLTRYLLQALGIQGLIKSPTYTLVESYEWAGGWIHHFDLYRIQMPEELHTIGIHEYFQPNALVLIEWPEKGIPILPKATIDLELQVVDLTYRLLKQKIRDEKI